MFTAAGEVVQPSEVLYKRPVLVERGSFRPATKLTLDLLDRALEQFLRGAECPRTEARRAGRDDSAEPEGHARCRPHGLPGPGGHPGGPRFRRAHLAIRTVTTSWPSTWPATPMGRLGSRSGLPAVRQIADEKYYTDLPGGVLESVGRLFKRSVKMYVVPHPGPRSGEIHTAVQGPMRPPGTTSATCCWTSGESCRSATMTSPCCRFTRHDVLARLQRRDPSWEEMVPAAVAETIKGKNLFAL